MAERRKNWIRAALDWIAGWCGYTRALPTEIIIFPNMESARHAGFRGDRHPEFHHIRAWWPGQDVSGLMGRAPRRITIGYEMTRTATSEGSLVSILRARQRTWGERAMWIGL